MKEILAGLIDGLDPTALLPDLEAVLARLADLVRIVMFLGPGALLIFGLIYLLLAPKEANHYVGFRCWWGMSSVEVWRFTQKLAGAVWTSMGLILGIVMFVLSKRYVELPQEEMLFKALGAIVWQIVTVLVSIVLINVVLIVMFNHKGDRRFGAETKKAPTRTNEAYPETDEPEEQSEEQDQPYEDDVPEEYAPEPEEESVELNQDPVKDSTAALDDILAEVEDILEE